MTRAATLRLYHHLAQHRARTVGGGLSVGLVVEAEVEASGTRDLVWNSATPDAGEHLGLLTGADVAIRGVSRYMVYSGFDDQNIPSGFELPTHAQPGFGPGVITLNVAARDAL